MKPVHWLLELSIEHSQAGDFEQVMKALVEEADREAGTMAYEWNFNDDGTVCYIYERYTNADAAMIHLGMFGEKFADQFLSVCRVTHLTILGFATDEVMAVLKGFNPTVLHQRAGFARFVT
ncbi:MAG: putative quinol monooxygenase [Granulosicoccus sp.]